MKWRTCRRSDKKVILVVNKVESSKDEEMVYDFYALGIGDLFAISASQGWVWETCWTR